MNTTRFDERKVSLTSRPVARWLFIAGVVGLIGVTIDLVRGPPASALLTAHGSALAALPIDHSVVKDLIDDASLEPGASVAAYETPIESSLAEVPAPAVRGLIDIDALEPGASVAAYGF
jgi:hypothetical protein